MMEPVILIETSNHSRTLTAVVEQDDRVAYFYLFPSELLTTKYSPRPCWLRNLKPAPEKRDTAAMKEGLAPMLEARYCNHPTGKPALEANRLSIVWTPEGDGAAVLYDNEILGVIPGWTLYSDEQNVAYAADCIGAGEDDQLMPLGARGKNAMYQKVDEAIAFQEEWATETSQAWGKLQEEYLKNYESVFGPLRKYYAIDGGQWPPMGLGRFEKDGIVYFLSLGIGIRPMPWIELLYNDRATGFRRMELAWAIKKDDFSETEIMEMAGLISSVADRPWKLITWLGVGHTILSQELPKPFESVIVTKADSQITVPMPELYGDQVNLFWLLPITELERTYAHHLPDAGHLLITKLAENGIHYITTRRAELPFD
ncbi:suppressor of fused domain protein [Chitinophaga silvatica]|uniref:Suppressor of fused domain protein n=1 Tax=Chitinophaga silvatica TaxID=2282649 RepID=A0A3E1Y8B5_9BACT|nr:suppressor of fused domain protein [Chitinophaga silvatica]RFS21415.1 suppressor of fused domain protein [Chitinophaga silvatica]